MAASDLATRAARGFLESLASSEEAQRECLLDRLVVPNASSRYGEEHGFATITSTQQYRERVPIVGYGDLRPWIERIGMRWAKLLCVVVKILAGCRCKFVG